MTKRPTMKSIAADAERKIDELKADHADELARVHETVDYLQSARDEAEEKVQEALGVTPNFAKFVMLAGVIAIIVLAAMAFG